MKNLTFAMYIEQSTPFVDLKANMKTFNFSLVWDALSLGFSGTGGSCG